HDRVANGCDTNKLHVHHRLWLKILVKNDPEYGMIPGYVIEVVTNSTPRVRICSQGEIRREYEQHLRQLEEENQHKMEAEQKASDELIRKLQEEGQMQLNERLQQSGIDEQVAKLLQKETNQLLVQAVLVEMELVEAGELKLQVA
ncbi:unnamed protein product, partial [Timema podura]|nr:unnamed protein product [Timema podura]